MIIISDDQRRALDFIQAATAGGYRPTREEVEEWRLRPEPKPGDEGQLLEPAVIEKTGAATGIYALADLQKTFGLWAASIAAASNKGTRVIKPAVYGPPGPPEGFLQHLVRLKWVDEDSRGGLGLTPLGRALMRAADSVEQSESAAIVLNPDDPLAYSKLIGLIAGQHGDLIVDPYLRAADLIHVLTATDIVRVLVGRQLSRADLAEMQTLVIRWPGRQVELRVAEHGVLHDRYVLAQTGVMMTGGSMNAIGRTLSTVVVNLPEEAAGAVRTTVEAWWNEAELLAQSTGEQSGGGDPEADAGANAGG